MKPERGGAVQIIRGEVAVSLLVKYWDYQGMKPESGTDNSKRGSGSFIS